MTVYLLGQAQDGQWYTGEAAGYGVHRHGVAYPERAVALEALRPVWEYGEPPKGRLVLVVSPAATFEEVASRRTAPADKVWVEAAGLVRKPTGTGTCPVCGVRLHAHAWIRRDADGHVTWCNWWESQRAAAGEGALDDPAVFGADLEWDSQ